MDGADHMGIYISPKVQTELVNWSFMNYVPKPGSKFNDQDTYYIFFSYQLDIHEPKYEFYLDFKTPDSWDQATFDIVLNGHYIHYDEERTPAFLSFINYFPKWTHFTSWMCSYKSFTF